MALLDSGDKLLKELELEDGLSASEKKAYVDSQVEALRQQLFRERVDLAISENIETVSEEQKESLLTKSREQKSNIKNYVRALKVLNALQDEL